MVTTERGEWPELLNSAVGNGVSGGRVTLRRQGPPSNSREGKLSIELREQGGEACGILLTAWAFSACSEADATGRQRRERSRSSEG